MLGFIFVLFISIFGCFVKDKRKILLVFAFILPLNDFLKNYFDILGGGTIFSFWKELLIVILFIRCKLRFHVGKLLYLWEFCALFYFIYFILGVMDFGAVSAFRTYRWLVVVPMLMLSISSLKLNEFWLKRIVTLLCFSSLFIAISGIIEIHCGFRLPIRMWMGNVVSVSPGYIEYNIPNFLMHNYDRMCGLMTSPNGFGNLMAIMCFILYFVLRKRLYSLHGFEKYFTYTCSFVFFVCLVESFCRTGWAQLLIGVMLVEYLNNRKSFVKYLFSMTLTVVLVVIILALVSDVFGEILEKTLTGEDASSATRGDNVLAGSVFLIEHFMGIGLGGCDITNDRFLYFSESSFMNICIESGFLGGAVFYSFCMRIIFILRHKVEIIASLSYIVLVLYVISSLPSVSFSAPYGYIVWILVGVGFSYNNKKIVTHYQLKNEQKTYYR